MDHTIFFDLGSRQRAELAGLPPAEAASLVVALAAALEVDQYVDDELLLFSGHALAETGHAGVDGAVLGWAGNVPSERRLAIVGGLLRGLWPRGPSPPARARMDELIRRKTTFGPASAGWRLATDALARTLRRSDLPPADHALLAWHVDLCRQAVERSGEHPGLAAAWSLP
jgi:hypothetical protein